MADENVVPEQSFQDESKPPFMNKRRVIMLALIGLVVALGGIGYYQWNKNTEEAKRKQAELEASPDYQLRKQLEFRKENKPPRFVKMDEFTVNLPGRGGEHYLQTNIVIRTGDAATEAKIRNFLPIIRDKVILVLSSRPMEQLATVEGKNMLAREIALVINAIIEPQLTAIFILQQKFESGDLRNLERIGAIPKQTTAGEKLTQTAVEAAAQYWKVTEMDLPVQAVLFDKLVMQ